MAMPLTPSPAPSGPKAPPECLFTLLERQRRHGAPLTIAPPAHIGFVPAEYAWLHPDTITTPLLALSGSTSPLPGYYLEQWQGERFAESAIACLLQLIQSRLLSLLYQGWRKYRPHLHHPNHPHLGWRHAWERWSGLSIDAQSSWLPIQIQLGGGGRECLQHALRQYSQLPQLELRHGTPRWQRLTATARCQLGHSRLGTAGHLGARAPSAVHQVTVQLAGLHNSAWLDWHPGGPEHTALSTLLRQFVSPALTIEWHYSLTPTARRQGRLGPRHDTRLGWNCHLGRPMQLATVCHQQPEASACAA